MDRAGGVWLLIEHRNGKLGDGSLELVHLGRALADRMGRRLVAVVPGGLPEAGAGVLGGSGADRVLVLEDPAFHGRCVESRTQILSDIIGERQPDAVLSASSLEQEDLLTRVAARLETGLVTSCERVAVRGEKLLLTRAVCGGRVSATFLFPAARPQMATVDVEALDAAPRGGERRAEVVRRKVDVEPVSGGTRSLGRTRGDPARLPLSEADIIVDGGRGLGSRGGFGLVEELAGLLGASVGATRMAVDAGWTTQRRQIGQTGSIVRPKLVIACGVSGAPQHLVGIRQARSLVAVNRDRAAPIFEVADVAVVADVLQLLPALISAVRERMAAGRRAAVRQVLDALGGRGEGTGGAG